MSEDPEIDLAHYGRCYATYGGNGSLTLEDGQRIDCEFTIGQLLSGRVILLSNGLSPEWLFQFPNITKFEGKTANDFHLSSAGPLREINYLPKHDVSRRPTVSKAYFLDQLTTEAPELAKSQKLVFGITNFEFSGTTPKEELDGSCHLVLPLRIITSRGEVGLELKRVRDYQDISRRLTVLNGIEVTCEVVFDNTHDLDEKEEVVDNLCYVLSVASGHKVQWILWKMLSENDQVVSSKHASRVTKPYSPLDVISEREADEIQAFIQNVYPVFENKLDVYKLKQGLIDSYLDAKAEGDYLEVRGAKLVVALELLKNIFLQLPSSPINELILDEEHFISVSTLVKDILREKLIKDGAESQQRCEVYSKIQELNRSSFRSVLEQICMMVNLQVDEKDMDLVIRSRNSLVHTGYFIFETLSSEEKEQYKLKMVWDEYLFLVAFLDKLILKLLGYSGKYFDHFQDQLRQLA